MAAIFHFLCVLLTAGAVVAAGSQFNLTILTTSSTAAEVTQLPSGRTYGGYATLQTALSKARVNLASTSTPTLAIHGLSALGMYSFSQYYKGKKEATYLSRLGFQYTTFGSRDLFHGTEVYANNFLNNTSVACISSNTWISKSSALSNLCQRYKVTTLTDANTQTTFKAAIVSYVVTDFCSFTFCAESASSPAQVKVLDIIPEMTAFIQQLQFQENPDVVIAMSSGLDLNGDLAIASAVPGIDVIITSDDKTVSSKSFPIAATGAEGGPVLIVADMTPEGVRGLARVDLQWRNGSLAAWSGTRDPLNSCQGDPSPLATCIPPDAAFVSDIVADYVEVDKALEVVIGSTTALLNGAQLPNHPCRRSDCTAGSVVCDSMLWVTDGQCDAAILNGGSIRDSLPAGNVTMKNIMGMLPNHNTISVTRLRGIDVLDALSSGLSKVFPQGSAGRFPQVGNIHYTYNVNNKPDALRLVSAQIFNRTQGTYVDIDPNAIYNICVNDYMLNGGDGYSMLLTNALSTFSQGTQLDVALRSYMAAQSPISPPAGQRILDLSTTSPSSPPLLGSCKFATSVTNASSILLDPCDGGSRFRTNVSWTITPTITSLRSINLSFGNFTMDPTTDVLYLYNPATNQLLQVRSPADNVSMVPANYTSLPSSVGIPNVVSVGVRFVANRPLTGSGVKLSYAAHDGCPGGYILDNGNCVGCPAGTYAGLLDVQCTACPAGSVTTTSGLETCAVCQEGTFSDAAGRTQCQTCDRGRIWISSTQCQCAAGTFFNDFTCLPIGSGSSQTGQIIGIALGLIVLGAGIGFYVYRRRMAAIKRRQMGTSKQKALKADVAMKRLVHDIVLSVMQIGMDAGECALDWRAFLSVPEDEGTRLFFIVGCIFQSLITLLSAALRIYNIQRLFRTRSSGIKLIAAGARTTSVEALKRIQDAENDPDLQLSLLSLNSLRQKVIITIAVAAPGMVKSAMMLLVSIVVAKHQGSGLTLLLAFGFSCLVFAINLQETLGWFHLRDTYRKEKQAADTKLASLGLRRPDGYHHRTQTEKDAVDYSDEESKAGGGGKRREIEAPGGETPSPVDGVATEKHIASHALEDEENP